MGGLQVRSKVHSIGMQSRVLLAAVSLAGLGMHEVIRHHHQIPGASPSGQKFHWQFSTSRVTHNPESFPS